MDIESARRLRKNERGVTLLITAVGMVSVLAMAVLAMDVVSLYVAKDQAQATADAAALAGAQALANSGTTSAPSTVPLSTVCNGSTGQADLWAQAVVAQSPVAGGLAGPPTTSCPTATNTNPRIQVTLTRTGLPTFFARIWGGGSSTVSAAAIAEAYNPSLDLNPGPPIQIQGVKPWLIFNCNTCPGGPAYFTSTYAVANGATFIGQPVTLTLMSSSTSLGPPPAPSPPPNTAQFFALDLPAPLSCPTNGAISCSQVGTGPPGIYYHDNIACSGSFVFGNNQSIPMTSAQVDTRSVGTLQARTSAGVQCLIHAAGSGLLQGQDTFTTGLPVTITGGSNNPDPALRGVRIHRSDSVVTAPVFNCPTVGPCDGTGAMQLQIVGFLQLAIQDVTGGGNIDAVILNAAGTDPASTGTPVIGAGPSPVPVRLIQ